MKKSTNQRRKLNRLLSFILSLSMILSCMEGLSLRAWAEGETVEAEDPIAEDPGVEEPDGADYVEWTATDSLPTEAGSYKLMNDVTLSTALWLRPAETGLMFVYDLDLNGKTITLEGDGKFNVGGETVSLRLKNGTIRSLGGKKDGAFILTANSNFKSGNVIADKVKFSGGVTTSRYQAIALSKCAYACSITDCSFSGFSYGEGSAIYIQDTEMSISGTRFVNNKNGSRGGAIYAEGNKELNISDCTFESNESGYGGAIYSDNAKVIVTKTEMIYNKAENQGGAIFACGNVLDISDSKIHWNSVTGKDSDQKSGAAIYCVEKTSKGSQNVCTLGLSGELEIKYNRSKGDVDSNIVVGKAMNLKGDVTTDSAIGVYLVNEDGTQDGTFASSTVASYLDASEFKCEVAGYRVLKIDKTLKFGYESTVSVKGGKIKSGSTTVTSAKMGNGETVNVVADDPAAGKIFKDWTATGITLSDADAQKASLSFTMPRNDVSLVANFIEDPDVTYTLLIIDGTVDGTGASKAQFRANETVNIVANEIEHSEFKNWTSNDTDLVFADAKAKATSFRMPARNIVVTANYDTSHKISVSGGTADREYARKDAEVTVTADPAPEGKIFDKWEGHYSYTSHGHKVDMNIEFAVSENEVTTFIMPDYDVKINATYKDDDRPVYEITVSGGSASRATAHEGDVVSISANEPEAGKVFDKWVCRMDMEYGKPDIADVNSPDTTFVMPDVAVYLTATYKDDENPVYKVTVSGGSASCSTAHEGDVVTINANAPEEGKVFDKWVTDPANSVTFYDANAAETTFVMPAKDVTVIAQYKEAGKPEPSPEGLGSALDPVPAGLAEATELYLVQGQKFTIGSDWTIVDKKKAGKFISISKKGLVKAKKVTSGGAVTISQNGTGRTISVNICKPVIDKKLELNAGAEGKGITLKDYGTLGVYWISSNPDVAKVSLSGFVTPIAKGKATVTAYINGSAYKCTVNVKEPTPVTTRTIHMNVNTPKAINIKGVTKKTVWTSTSENVAKVNGKKITSSEAGMAKLSASVNEVYYYIDVFSEDITMSGTGLTAAKGKNKYTLTLTAGQSTNLAFAAVEQPVVFKSSKPEIAFIDEGGYVVARSKGKAKFTTKVNGKAITITVVVN